MNFKNKIKPGLKIPLSIGILLINILLYSSSCAQKVDDYVQIGKRALTDDNYVKALEYFNYAVRQKPTSYEGYFLRGVTKYYLSDYPGAELDLTKAIEFDPYDPECYHYRAIVRAAQYNLGRSLDDYAAAIEIDPKNPFYYLNRARANLFMKHYEDVIKDCDKAQELKYPHSDLYAIRGMAQAGMELFEEAIIDLNKAIDKNPNNTNLYIQRGGIWMEFAKPDSAIQDFNIVIQKDSLDSQAIFNRALARMDIGDTLGASNDLNTVIRLSPRNSYAYYDRAVLKIGQQDISGALADLDRVIRLNPENIVVYLFRAKLKHASRDLKGALADLDKAIEIYPDFADGFYERSLVKKDMNDYRGSDQDLKIAYQINEFNFTNDSLKLHEMMYLKKLLAFSGEFHNNESIAMGLQKDQEKIELQTIYNIVLFSTSLEKVSLYDTYNKTPYHTPVITLSNFEFPINEALVEIQIDTLSLEIHRYPDSSLIYHKRAILYAQLNDYEGAIQDEEKAVKFKPEFAMAYFNRANIRLKLTELIDFDDDSQFQGNSGLQKVAPEMVFDSGYLKKAYQQIIADYTKTISLDPDFYYAYFNRAYARFLSGDSWGAIDDYSKVITMKPELSDAYYNKGLILLFLKMNTTACNHLGKAGELGLQDAYTVIGRYCAK